MRHDKSTQTYWQTMFLTYYMHIPCMILTIRNISLKELFYHRNWEPVSLLCGRECTIFMFYLDTLTTPKILTRVSPAFQAGTWRSAGRSWEPSNAAAGY
jgi:hypothetical protein